MSKSADAFRTISEVSEWLETPAHVLRFWESKFTQVKPVKRAGGRRYYRPSDMLLLGGIKKLLHSDGMTIKGVQKLLRENGVQHVADHSQALDDLTRAEAHDAAIEIAAEPVSRPPEKQEGAAQAASPPAPSPEVKPEETGPDPDAGAPGKEPPPAPSGDASAKPAEPQPRAEPPTEPPAEQAESAPPPAAEAPRPETREEASAPMPPATSEPETKAAPKAAEQPAQDGAEQGSSDQSDPGQNAPDKPQKPNEGQTPQRRLSFRHLAIDQPAPPAEAPATPDKRENVAEAEREPAPAPEPAAPKPRQITLPDDPADDITADPGALSRLAALTPAQAGAIAADLAAIAKRVAQRFDGVDEGQDR